MLSHEDHNGHNPYEICLQENSTKKMFFKGPKYFSLQGKAISLYCKDFKKFLDSF